MKRNEPVSHLMTHNPYAVQRGQPVSEVRKIMAETGVHHVPVVEGKTLVGMVSMTDLVRLSWGAADGRGLDALLDHTVELDQVMTRTPVHVRQSQSIREAAELLSPGTFHAIPVVDEAERLTGILTTTDLIRYLLEQY